MAYFSLKAGYGRLSIQHHILNTRTTTSDDVDKNEIVAQEQ